MSEADRTSQVFVRLDSNILSKLREALPGMSIQTILVDLTFHLAETLHDEKFDLTSFYKEAAARAKESLKNSETESEG